MLGLDTAGNPAAPFPARSEQGKLPAAQAFTLAERDKAMSEQTKPSFMQELNKWIDESVIYPLIYGGDPEDPEARGRQDIEDQVRQAIREKVLDSYKNGCRAGAGAVRKEQRNAQARPARKEAQR
jgi:hypothetical protein